MIAVFHELLLQQQNPPRFFNLFQDLGKWSEKTRSLCARFFHPFATEPIVQSSNRLLFSHRKSGRANVIVSLAKTQSTWALK